ncbi:hypothetical protein [Pseudoteredinibacter isoporae]|uniref:MSHA biogenesis protein MshJ n=1 Tax=Pseudoteredinibacter isoporae TaxID=570281 RepID=A0A7X0MWD4_9GAMM|nr:hypothetical protein [Pseudoteredinibacter isoporae]MBB6522363.1 MSHA biogenesis protein MshJ [Pseudoteredinibacter isoporae]NHO87896.1 hypothetical protein [Pseudoteredinibacter isoporae]NIB23773.1 hypothetical protein [Pseudoteredinibacter isoporae]
MTYAKQSPVEQLKHGFEKRNRRERLLIVAAVLALSYLLIEATLGAWLDGKTKKAKSDLQMLRQAQLETESELAVFAASELSRSNQEQEILIRHLQEKNERLENELGPLRQQVLSRRQFMELLRGLAENAKDIRLASLRELPKETEEAQQGRGKEKRNRVLDKHRLRLKLEGDYLSLAGFLAKLEQSEWPIFWSSLEYELTAYPRASMSLDLYTLAPERVLPQRQAADTTIAVIALDE